MSKIVVDPKFADDALVLCELVADIRRQRMKKARRIR